MVKKNLFICDNCKKKDESDLDSYLYDKGWMYCYKFDFKIEANKKISSHDKHFCCVDCFLSYLNKKVKEKIKNIEDDYDDIFDEEDLD